MQCLKFMYEEYRDLKLYDPFSYNSTSIQGQIIQIYNGIFKNKSFDISKIFNMTLNNYFEGHKVINVKIIGQALNNISSIQNENGYIGSSVESIYYDKDEINANGHFGIYHLPKPTHQKCFTFFSWLDKKSRNIQIDVDEIIIEIKKVQDPLYFYGEYSSLL